MTAQLKRSANAKTKAKPLKQPSLSNVALKAFHDFKTLTGLADESQVLLELIQKANPESLFDSTTPQDFFRGEQLEDKQPLTELALVRRAAELLGVPLPQLIRSGSILLAKREILTRSKFLTKAGEPDTLRSGVAGSADRRMRHAFNTLALAHKPISPARLAKLASTNFNSAQRWIQLNHPQLLLHQQQPMPAQPENSSPAAPLTAPKPPAAGPNTPQEPAQGSQPGSTPPKAKKSAKRLRNPEKEPF
jgi:hypothetical protein